MMTKRLFNLQSGQTELLKRVADAASISASELLRRMIDHCCRHDVIGDVVPTVSGRMPQKPLPGDIRPI